MFILKTICPLTTDRYQTFCLKEIYAIHFIRQEQHGSQTRQMYNVLVYTNNVDLPPQVLAPQKLIT